MSLIMTLKLKVRLSSLDDLRRAVEEFARVLNAIGLGDIRVYTSYGDVVMEGGRLESLTGGVRFHLDGDEVSISIRDYGGDGRILRWISQKFEEFLMQRESLNSILADHPFARVDYHYDPDEDVIIFTVDW